MTIKLPNDLVWGTATSAYQIEGSHNADGKGKVNGFSEVIGNNGW